MREAYPAGRLGEVISEMGEAGGYLWSKGWAERNGGNISVDVTGLVGPEWADAGRMEMEGDVSSLAGREYAVTATGSRLREVGTKWRETVCVVRVEADGTGVRLLEAPGGAPNGAPARPTSELESHLGVHGVYRAKGWEGTAVVHSHPTELVALTHIGRFQGAKEMSEVLWRMHPEVVVFVPEGVSYLKFTVPGTAAMGRATVEAVKERPVLVWEKHGCLAVGRGVLEAFDLLDTVNKGAALYLAARASGEEPEGMSEEEMAAVRRAFL